MTAQLQSIISQAQRLSDTEQRELIAAISVSLQRRYSRSSDFWVTKSISELADEQQINTLESIANLKAKFWPDEDSIDEFNQFIRQQRQDDRLSE